MLNSCHRAGFTLIELAMVLVLAGLMLGFGLQATQGPDKCYEATREQMATIQQAIDKFVIANKRYPVPAGKNLGVNDPEFGQSVANYLVPHDPSNTTSAIVYAGGGAGAITGALPFQALGLPSSFAADCWGNKFTYTVVKALTETSLFIMPKNVGTIPVITGSRQAVDVVYLTQKAAYVVISHGPNGVGATPRNYSTFPNLSVNRINCNVMVTSNPQLDLPNCDTSNTLYFSAPYNTGNDPIHFFDDIVVFAEKPLFSCDLTGAAPVLWGPGNACSGVPHNSPTNRLPSGETLAVFNEPVATKGSTNVRCEGDGTLKKVGPDICHSGTWNPICNAGVTVVTCSTGNAADCDPAAPVVATAGHACVGTGIWTQTCPVPCGGGVTIVSCSTGNPADCDPATQPIPGPCNTHACYPGIWIKTCPVLCGGGTYSVTCSTGNPADCDPATQPAGGACNSNPCCTGIWVRECVVTGCNNTNCFRTPRTYCSTLNPADCSCTTQPADMDCSTTDPINLPEFTPGGGCEGGGCTDPSESDPNPND